MQRELAAARRRRRRLLPPLVRQLHGHRQPRRGGQRLHPFSVTAPSTPGCPAAAATTLGGLYNLNPNKVGAVNNYITYADNYGKQIEHWNGVDVTVNARLPPRPDLQGGLSTGRTSTDSCAIVPT